MDSEKINTAHRPFEALEIGAFRWFVAYRFFFTFGLQMLATIAGWQIWAMTHSKMQLGYAGLVEAIPSIGMALYAGHIADKYARKKSGTGSHDFHSIVCFRSADWILVGKGSFLYSIYFRRPFWRWIW